MVVTKQALFFMKSQFRLMAHNVPQNDDEKLFKLGLCMPGMSTCKDGILAEVVITRLLRPNGAGESSLFYLELTLTYDSASIKETAVFLADFS